MSSKILSEMISALIKDDTKKASSLLTSYISNRSRRMIESDMCNYEDEEMVTMTAEDEEENPEMDDSFDQDSMSVMFRDEDKNGSVDSIKLSAEDLDDVTLAELEALLSGEDMQDMCMDDDCQDEDCKTHGTMDMMDKDMMDDESMEMPMKDKSEEEESMLRKMSTGMSTGGMMGESVRRKRR